MFKMIPPEYVFWEVPNYGPHCIDVHGCCFLHFTTIPACIFRCMRLLFSAFCCHVNVHISVYAVALSCVLLSIGYTYFREMLHNCPFEISGAILGVWT